MESSFTNQAVSSISLHLQLREQNQRMQEAELQADPLTTICSAVWQHGLAADKPTSERKN